MKEKLKGYLKPEYILPVIHFLLTFVLEHFIFYFQDNDLVVRTTEVSSFLSLKFEIVMAYIISKIIAGILIWCSWRLLFMMIKKEIPVKSSIFFSIIFVIGLIILLILYPGDFTTSGDNLIVYAHAVNFIPDYWFSVYTSTFYAACMMVLPSPFMVVAYHWLGLLFGVGYIYFRIINSTIIPKKFRFCGFILFLFPIVHVIIMDVYRTELYCVYVFIYMAVVLLDIIEKKQRDLKSLIILALIGAMVGVWRTEGIVLALISYVALVLFCYRNTIKNTIIALLAIVVAVVVLSLPQRVGTIRYYRNDYTIINLTRPLGMIFNNPDSNLNYKGAKQDIEAIEALVPVEYLKEHYLDGFRRRNIEMGSVEINQSLASKEVSDKFVKSGYNLILHNLDTFFDTQLDLLNRALGTGFTTKQYYYTGEGSNAPEWDYDMWQAGEFYFNLSRYTVKWAENITRFTIEEKILTVRSYFLGFFDKTHIKAALNTLGLLYIVVVTLVEIIRWIKKRTRYNFAFAAVCMAIVLQTVAIVLCMPAGIEAYFRGVYFAIYEVMILWPIRLWVIHEEEAKGALKD